MLGEISGLLRQLFKWQCFSQEEQCEHFYAEAMGRPSLAPGRYFRLLLIGYFEGIEGERGITWRAADSLALRSEDAFPRKAHHEFASIIFPGVTLNRIRAVSNGDGFGAARGVTVRAGAVGEPKVIDHDFIEQPGRIFKNRLQLVLRGFVAVTGSNFFPTGGGLTDFGSCDTARDFKTGRLELLFRIFEGFFLGLITVAKSLDINFRNGGGFAPVDCRLEALLGGKAVPDVLRGEEGGEAVGERVLASKVPETGIGGTAPRFEG